MMNYQSDLNEFTLNLKNAFTSSYISHGPILNKRPGNNLDSVSLHLRVNSMSRRSPHKGLFVFSIHTSGHKEKKKKKATEALPNISFSWSFLSSLKCRYGTCSTPFNRQTGERLGWKVVRNRSPRRQSDHSERRLITGWTRMIIRGRSPVKAASYRFI